MDANATQQNTVTVQPPLALSAFRNRVGVSRTTVWRWREEKWLETVNIGGREYVTAEALAKFNARVEAGEFAKASRLDRRHIRTHA